MEIPASQRNFIVGTPEGDLMRAISTHTGCIIHFPLPSIKSSGSMTYVLTGSAGAVVSAIRAINVRIYTTKIRYTHNC